MESSNQTDQSSKLANANISKLLLTLSIPAIIGMTVNALYNVVDAAFVGRGAGPLAIGGLTIVFPIQMLIISLAQIFGIGAASIISRKLGEKNHGDADVAAGNAASGSVISGLLCTILGYIFRIPVLQAFGVTTEIMPYALEYYNIILLGSVFVSFSMSAVNLARAEGRAMAAMTGMLIGTVSNIILDPILIFKLDMGIRGAAWATVIGQVLAFIYIVIYFMKRSSLKINRTTLFPRFHVFAEMVALGLPAFIRHAGGSLLAVVINNALGSYGGNMAIAAYGTINRIIMFGIMPIIGFNQGFQPIVGYNFSVGHRGRIRKALKLAMAYTTGIAVFFSLLLLFVPELLINIFSTDPQLHAFAVPAARIVVAFFSIIGIQSIGSSYFQAVGKAIPAFILGLSRQFLVLIPMVLICAPLFGLNGIWVAFPAADLISTIITVVWLRVEWIRETKNAEQRELLNR